MPGLLPALVDQVGTAATAAFMSDPDDSEDNSAR
jgi:hypothetical protein